MAKARLAKARLRARRIGRLGKLHRPAGARLFGTGCLPQAKYHAPAYGVPPAQMRRLRSAASFAGGLGGPGRCATTAIQLRLGANKDPCQVIAADVVKQWLLFWRGAPKAQTTRAWVVRRRELLALQPGNRWRHVKGPLSATILTLESFGWQAELPYSWVDVRGDRWSFTTTHMDFHPILSAVKADALDWAWSQAARFRSGQGLEGGVDLRSLQKTLRRFRKAGSIQQSVMMEKVATAGIWTRQRRVAEHL